MMQIVPSRHPFLFSQGLKNQTLQIMELCRMRCLGILQHQTVAQFFVIHGYRYMPANKNSKAAKTKAKRLKGNAANDNSMLSASVLVAVKIVTSE